MPAFSGFARKQNHFSLTARGLWFGPLGVTYNHPIYSATAGDWRLAGELEIGEEVLTYNGAATLCSKAPLPGAHTVYNLEVKDWHNFLVGELGVVVHNNYFPKANELAKFFNVARSKLDRFITDIVSDWRSDFPHWMGNNPDIGYNNAGKLIFKSTKPGPDKGRIWETDSDITNYIE